MVSSEDGLEKRENQVDSEDNIANSENRIEKMKEENRLNRCNETNFDKEDVENTNDVQANGEDYDSLNGNDDVVNDKEEGEDQKETTEEVNNLEEGEDQNETTEDVNNLEEEDKDPKEKTEDEIQILEDESKTEGEIKDMTEESKDMEDEPEQSAPTVTDTSNVTKGTQEEISPITEDNSKASTSTESQDDKTAPKRSAEDIVCIEIDDENEEGSSNKVENKNEEPPVKKMKPGEINEKGNEKETQNGHPNPEKDKNNSDINSSEDLLDRLQEYICTAIDKGENTNRKVLDSLLAAINIQVQKQPLNVRQLIIEKKLILPNTISFPPSQVVDMMVEHDPDFPISKVISKLFGDERPKMNETERKERVMMRTKFPAPHMTKLLCDIGQDLVQEMTYSDIVNAKNLPEVPKNLENYHQVAQQLKPVWDTLKKRNEPYKLKYDRCKVCGFQTESKLVMKRHKSTLHFNGSKYQCALCREYDTNEQRMRDHYLDAHLIIAIVEEKEGKYPCVICDQEFNLKGQRDQHFKSCKKDIKSRYILAPSPDDVLMLNKWLWDRATTDPGIHQPQPQPKKTPHIDQERAAKQLELFRKQQKQLLQQQQQQQFQQQQIKQIAALMKQQGPQFFNNPAFASAVQAHLRSKPGATPAGLALLLQKQMAAVAAAAAAKNGKMNNINNNNRTAKISTPKISKPSTPNTSSDAEKGAITCEICDVVIKDNHVYFEHLTASHSQLAGKSMADMIQGAPLACSRCRDRFWTYEGLERHLVMSHALVTADLLQKAQKKMDKGRCQMCGKHYAFNILQHLVADHQVKLCSAEIMYSCDVCSFKCSSYNILEKHLAVNHPKEHDKNKKDKAEEECITLDD